jgi:hypothetical protein
MSRKKKEKLKTLDKILIIVGIFIALFITSTVIIYTYNGWQYDVLIPCVVGSGILETINTMIITVNKIRNPQNIIVDANDNNSVG